MKFGKISILFAFLLFSLIASAQTTDFGIWSEIGAGKDLGKWNINAYAGLRTQNNSQELNKWYLETEVSYNVFKFLKLGASYQFIDFNDVKYNDMQPRHRVSGFVQAKKSIGRFSFSLREKFQITYKDESDRIKKSGKINTYTINPEAIWRNRIKARYNIPHFPINPSLSFESFYQLNNPEGNSFCKLRYTLSLDYTLKKHHEFELYGLMDNEINVSSPEKMRVLGISYFYSF